MTVTDLPVAHSLEEHALDYARTGLEVFPVNPRDKTPLVSQYKATTDLDRIHGWWRRWSNALIGHRISPDNVVLDIDPRHGGDQTWRALLEEFPARPVTRWHRSGRGDGGGHTWWLRPSDKTTVTRLDQWARERGLGHEVGAGRWTCGIDILHYTHRYTILPPSPHPDTGRPYTWATGGANAPVAPMPALLADLLTDDTPPPAPAAPRPAQPDSIADWYTATHTWTDLLIRHGWTLRAGTGDTDGSRWRHPTATSAFSATIRHGCLFVYSPNTPFEPTNPGDAHGYTLFRAWALLDHGGDLAAAGRAAREAKTGRPAGNDWLGLNGTARPGAAGPAEQPVEGPARLPDEFWEARPHLTHIHQAAHARIVSAEAVLHACLARIAAITPHTVQLPATIATRCPLSYFAALVGGPSSGKSAADAVATDLIPAPDWLVDHLPVGSGEGLIDSLFELIDDIAPNGNAIKVKRQTKHNAYVWIDEGQALTATGSRNGTTIMQTIRTLWTGGTAGQANASIERRRILPAGTYTFGIVAGFQPALAGGLLDDVAGGTPQRFGWADADDPTLTPPAPRWPGRLNWVPPTRTEYGADLRLDDTIVDEIVTNRYAVVTKQTEVAPLDAHADLYRLKVAGLLAVLDGRRDVTGDDWHLAGIIRERSNTVRSTVVEAVAYEASIAEEAHRRKLAGRAVHTEEAVELRAVVDCARKIAEKVWADPDRWTVKALHGALTKRLREVREAGIAHAVAEGWIVETAAEGQGTAARRLSPGKVRP